MAKATAPLKNKSDTKRAVAKSPPAKPAVPDDQPIVALDLGPANLSPAMQAYFQKCQEKLGFVPNVLIAYAFDSAKLEAFAAMYNDLMLAPSGLSKLEREMIAVAVSSQNRCYYCLTAHGQSLLENALPFWERAQERLRRQLGETDWCALTAFTDRVTAAALAAERAPARNTRLAPRPASMTWTMVKGGKLAQPARTADTASASVSQIA